MRRSDREVTDPRWWNEVIDAAPYLVLALHDDPAPYTVPLCFVRMNGALYLHMAQEGKKLDLLGRNPRAGFVAVVDAAVVAGETACAHGMRYRSVAGMGTCTIVEDSMEKRLALGAFARKYAGEDLGVFSPESLAATVVVRLDPVAVTGKRSGPA